MSKIAQKKFEIIEYTKTENATVDGMAELLNELTRLCQNKKTESPKPILWVGSPDPIQYNKRVIKSINEDYFVIEYPSDCYSIEIVSESNPLAISDYGNGNTYPENINKSAKEVLKIHDILGCKKFYSIDFISVLDSEVGFQVKPNDHRISKLDKEELKKVCNYVANY